MKMLGWLEILPFQPISQLTPVEFDEIWGGRIQYLNILLHKLLTETVERET